MRYAVLLHQRIGVWEEADEARRASYHQAHLGFAEAVRRRATWVGGEALQPSDMTTTLRRTDGEVVLTDGAYDAASEEVGGFYLLDAPDLDTVIGLCELLPDFYGVEIRPVAVVEMGV